MAPKKSLESRVALLERQLKARNAGRCGHCRDWPYFQMEATTTAAFLNGEHQPKPVPPCPHCGWQPMRIVEIVIASHKDIEDLDAYDEQKRQA